VKKPKYYRVELLTDCLSYSFRVFRTRDANQLWKLISSAITGDGDLSLFLAAFNQELRLRSFDKFRAR
jgi:hypothetical protein